MFHLRSKSTQRSNQPKRISKGHCGRMSIRPVVEALEDRRLPAVNFTIAPVHNLAVANQYLTDVLAPKASNIYGTPAMIQYDAAGNITAQTECGSFTSLLLQNSYPAVTGSVIKALTGSTSPDAAQWYDAVSAQPSAPTADGTFALHARTQVAAIQPGDFLAAKYANGNSTGHVMTVESMTLLGVNPNVGGVLIPGAWQLNVWRAQVIDSTSTPHGHDPMFPDSRTAAGGQGIGSGTILLYADFQSGALVGWTWDTQQLTPYQCTSPAAPQYRPMVIGDPEQDKTISPFIYGVNDPLNGAYANGTLRRLGGNRYTAYNWVTNYSNSGNDNGFTNDDYLKSLGGNDQVAGGVLLPALQDDAMKNASTLLTVPINGYVAADKDGAVPLGDPSATKRLKPEQARKGAKFTLTPAPGDPVVYQDEFVNWVKNNVNPNSPVFFSLDNEPDLWSETHKELRKVLLDQNGNTIPDPVDNLPEVAPLTYAELLQKSKDYAAAIKSVMPNAKVFGPASYGWGGYVNLNDAPDAPLNANFPDFLDYYLQQMKAAGNAPPGQRLLDALDLHWYPEARDPNRVARIVHLGPGDGQATTPEEIAAVQEARRQAPRSLWDPSYPEDSWIRDSLGGPIDLLPQLLRHIDQNYAGTKLSFSEYNYGGGGDISGGIAEADVLGIFGRQGVYAAAEWQVDNQEPFIGGAFQMFRNFDGNNSTFGDKSVLASTNDVTDSSVYASTDSANPSVMTLVVINKTAQPLPSILNLNHVLPGATASIYQLTSASPNPQAAGQMVIADPSQFNYTMPAYSVSTIRIVPPSPFALAGGKLTINGDQDQPDENDSLVVDTTPAGKIQVTLNQQTMLYDPGAVQSIDLRPGGGPNNISVNRSPVDVSIHGTGTDTVFVGTSSMAGTRGVVHVAERGGGAELDLFASSGSPFTITGSQVLQGNSLLVDYSGVSILSAENAGPGALTYVLGDGTHNLDNLPPVLFLYGSNTQQDTLTVNDGGAADAGVTPVHTTFEVGAAITRTESATVASPAGPVSRAFTSQIHVHGTGNLTLQGGGSPTSFVVPGTGGDDVIFSPAQLNVRGGSTADSLTLDDHLIQNLILTPQQLQQFPGGHNLLASSSYLVAEATVTRTTTLRATDPATGNVVSTDTFHTAISYSHLASLTIDGGQCDDTYNVQSTPASTAVSIYTDAGHDVVMLDDTQDQPGHGLFGNLTIDGQGGTNDSFQGTFKTFTPALTLANFASATLDVMGDFTGSFLAPTVGTLPAPIDHITVGGSMQAGSRIKVGYLKVLTVQKNLFGVVDGYGPVADKATQFTIDTVTVNGVLWGTTGSITAPSIRAINMQPAATFAGHATETAPGADFQSLNLGTIASTGTIDAAIVLSAIVSGDMNGRISVTGDLNSLNVGGSLGGTVSAATIGGVSVGQDLTGQLTATRGMRSLSVGGLVTGNVSVAVGGTPGDDSFVIQPAGVLLNGAQAFSGPYTNLRVNGGGGNDSFLVQGVAARAALTIDAGTGGGNSAITVVMGHLLGPVTLTGTTGTTQVTVNAPAGRNVLTLTATQLIGAGEALNFNLGTTFTRLIVDGSAGPNELIVQGTPPAPLTLINVLLPTVTRVTPSAHTADFGQALTFMAAVSAAVGTPGGLVDFFDTTTGVDLGSEPLFGGVAVLTTSSLTPGSHVLAVSYGGQGQFLGSSTSTTVSILSSTFILSSAANLALALSDDARLQVPGLLQVDSTSTRALFAGGNTQITAGSIQVAGKALVTDHASLVVNGHAIAGDALPHASLPDPLASLSVPQVSVPPGSIPPTIDLDGGRVMTLAPGVYRRITVAGNATLLLRSGIYVVAGGGITLIGNGRVTCVPADGHTGVLLYNAGSNYVDGRGSPTYGSFALGGNASVELTPLTTGAYAGVLYFQARDNPREATLSGHGLALWSGVFYAPKAALYLSGSGQVGGGPLGVSLVVDQLHLSANTTAGERIPSRLTLYIDDPHHRLGATELAQVRQAWAALAAELAPFGVTVMEVSSLAAANVVLTPEQEEDGCPDRYGFEMTLLDRCFARLGLDESFYLV